MNLPIAVVTGLPAAGKSFFVASLQRGWKHPAVQPPVSVAQGRQELSAVCAGEAGWCTLRAALKTALHVDGDGFWPAPGIENLRTPWSPFAHAELERRCAPLVARSIASRAARMRVGTLVVEATPILALELISTLASAVAILVRTTEAARTARLARRLIENDLVGYDCDETARRVAAFHRAAYQPALFALSLAPVPSLHLEVAGPR